MRPWSLPDVRDVAIAVVIYHAGIIALAWWAGDRTAVNRMRAQAECPGPEKVARRVVDLRNGEVRCTYFWKDTTAARWRVIAEGERRNASVSDANSRGLR